MVFNNGWEPIMSKVQRPTTKYCPESTFLACHLPGLQALVLKPSSTFLRSCSNIAGQSEIDTAFIFILVQSRSVRFLVNSVKTDDDGDATIGVFPEQCDMLFIRSIFGIKYYRFPKFGIKTSKQRSDARLLKLHRIVHLSESSLVMLQELSDC